MSSPQRVLGDGAAGSVEDSAQPAGEPVPTPAPDEVRSDAAPAEPDEKKESAK